jgi:hypothetical protein
MRRFSLVLFGVLVLGVGPARAEISYQYITDQQSYSATAAGQSITVYLFLQEQGATTSTGIINNDGGLFGAGVLATQTKVTGGTSGSTFTVGSLQQNKNDPVSGTPPGFGSAGLYSYKPNTATQQGGLETINTQANAPFTTDISKVNGASLTNTITNAIYLGSVTVLSGAAGTTTTFTVTSYKSFNNVDGNTLTNNTGFDLDVTGSAGGTQYIGADHNPFTFTVTVAGVPEPSSLLLCGMAMLGGAFGAWRRRVQSRRQAVEAAI